MGAKHDGVRSSRGGKPDPADAATLEAEIEAFWLRMSTWARPWAVYVTRTGRVITQSVAERHPTASLVGTYDRRASLAGFREDVFFAWQGLVR
jgi:hypothetical protein